MSMSRTGYITEFKNIEPGRNKILENMFEWTGLINNEIKLTDKTNPISEIEKTENQIRFKFCDYNILIYIGICASKGIGFIKWYYEKPEHEEKPRMILFAKDTFNFEGVITIRTNNQNSFFTDGKEKNGHPHYYEYYLSTLSRICEKVDQIEFDEKTP